MKPSLTLLLITWSACLAVAQTPRADTVVTRKPDILDSLSEVLSAEDSLAIFDLIDSMLLADPSLFGIKEKSQMAVRLGYNSNITADNRTFNISQFGLAPGLSYYHKSGAYVDATTYWSNEYKPSFYLTVASAGYLHTFSKHYSLLAEYSHYFYNQPSDSTVSIPYTNNVGVSNYFEFKPVMLRLDYYLYFGERTAHRIMPSVGLNLVKRNFLGFDRVMFFPMFAVMFGSEQITTYGLYPNTLLRILYNRTHVRKVPLYYEEHNTEFGVMNYGFTIPLSFTKKNWSFLLSYAYNIPKALPGETLSLENTGYLSFSITKYFDF
ncbi:MAG: hypothetical protein JNL40_03650 [Cyclobacteriaceae bacterium]|nr:hypothetical protein [Cyclobacteriaceae bacterium]